MMDIGEAQGRGDIFLLVRSNWQALTIHTPSPLKQVMSVTGSQEKHANLVQIDKEQSQCWHVSGQMEPGCGV